MNPDPPTPSTSAPGQRYLSLALWLLLLATLIFIPFKIISVGFLPGGDARRHVAHVFTEKTYREIVVMRPEYKVDHSPGWEWLLRQVQHATNWDADALMSFSIVVLLLCVFFAPLPWLRRPEAWLAALLVMLIALPDLMMRFCQSRPFMITEGVLIAVLFSWSKIGSKKPSNLKLALTAIGFALSVWMHGAWYLWVFVLAAFFLAREWWAALWLSGCWLVGVVAGACLTGSPVAFLSGAVFMAARVSAEHVPQWMLVGEFQPSNGEFTALTILAAVFLWRRQVIGSAGLVRCPVFWLIAIGWVLSFKADRCWADWGIPAVLVWLTMQFEEILPRLMPANSGQRLLAGGLLALPLFLQATNDLDRRYTSSLEQYFVDANDPKLAGWLPEAGGIFYSARMDFFYNTFYKNPRADWRYLTGFEPALMPDDDLKTLRSIQGNHGAAPAYEPWVKKMTSADRLAITSGDQPDLPELEWHPTEGSIWIGRLPKAKAH